VAVENLNMKKAYKSLCALLLMFALAPIAEAEESGMFLSIATGGAGGVYYPLGKKIAKLLTDHVAEVEVTAMTTDASEANVNLIAKREAALALVQNDMAIRAVKGEKPFKEPIDNLTMIASLYPEQLQCVTVRGSGVKTISDLRGKRVSVGAPGSGTADCVNVILSAAGIKYADIDVDFLDFADTAERMQHGQLDAGFVLAGAPTPAVTALAVRKDLDLAAFEEELLDKLSAAYPYFTQDVIPAGTYRGVNHDTLTAAVMAVLVCDADMSDDLVYNVTQAIFENLAELAPAHPKAKLISLDTALSAAAIKVHPGAARYYAEKGLKVPTF